MELEKAVAFLKSAKSDKVVLRQESTGKFLYIVAGGNKIQLPSTDDIISASKTVVQGKLVAKSADSGWKSFAGEIIDTHVTVQTKDLISLSGMKNLVKKDSQFKLRVHCGEEELGIVAGKAVTGRLFTVLPVTDTDGPNATVQTNFGDWFLHAYNIDEGSARLHFADNSLVIFEQNNTLLLIVTRLSEMIVDFVQSRYEGLYLYERTRGPMQYSKRITFVMTQCICQTGFLDQQNALIHTKET